jgi:hypothetical protein
MIKSKVRIKPLEQDHGRHTKLKKAKECGLDESDKTKKDEIKE